MAKMMFFVLVSEPCVGVQKNSASNFIDVFYIEEVFLTVCHIVTHC